MVSFFSVGLNKNQNLHMGVVGRPLRNGAGFIRDFSGLHKNVPDELAIKN